MSVKLGFNCIMSCDIKLDIRVREQVACLAVISIPRAQEMHGRLGHKTGLPYVRVSFILALSERKLVNAIQARDQVNTNPSHNIYYTS